jgi:spore germination protein KB
LADYRPITFPIGTIIGALSFLLFANIHELLTFLSKVWGPYSMPIELGLPLILLTAAWIRKKGGKP